MTSTTTTSPSADAGGTSVATMKRKFTKMEREALRLADSNTLSTIRNQGATLYNSSVTQANIISCYNIPNSEVSNADERRDFISKIFFKIAIYGLDKPLKTIQQTVGKRNNMLPEPYQLPQEELNTIYELAKSYLRLEHENLAQDAVAGRDPNKPLIITTERPLDDITNDAIHAIREGNEPHLFVYGGAMVRVEMNERNEPKIRTVDEDVLRGEVVRLANWVEAKTTGSGDEKRVVFSPVTPSRHQVRDILSLSQDKWGLPSLLGIISCPVIHNDGSLSDVMGGYDPETGVYFCPPKGFSMPDIPEKPTPEDVAEAMKLIEEIFIDFPFADNSDSDAGASRANTYAALFTAVLRSRIEGMVPCFLADKPLRGTGASLLQRAIGVIVTGVEPPTMVLPKSEEEWEKKVFSILRSGKTIEIIDNISGSLGSDVFASTLTSPFPSNRVLGQSVEVALPNRLFWMTNGNNVQIRGDLARRIWYTRLDAQDAMPWMRDSFKHPDLIKWCIDNRGNILAAIFTITRAWIQDGRPIPEDAPIVGSFEEWSRTIAGVLCQAGVSGFMKNAMELYTEADSELSEWEMFFSTIWDIYPNQPWTAAVIEKRLVQEKHDSVADRCRLIEVLPTDISSAFSNPNASFTRVLGKTLSKRKDVRYPSGLMLKKGKAKGKVVEWLVVKIETKNQSPDFYEEYEGSPLSSSTTNEVLSASSEPRDGSFTKNKVVRPLVEPRKQQEVVLGDGGFGGFGGFVPVQQTPTKEETKTNLPKKNNTVHSRAETNPQNPSNPHTTPLLPDKNTPFGRWLQENKVTYIIHPETYSPISHTQSPGQNKHMMVCSVRDCNTPPSVVGNC